MEISPRHMAPMPRRFGLFPQVQGIGHIPHKPDWVRNVFTSFNYSFILRGGGLYVKSSRSWNVAAPCVITQWPGEYVEYGPTEPWGFWEEVYVMYSPQDMDVLVDRRLADPARPVWAVQNLERLTQRLTELAEATRTPLAPGLADRIDGICASAVLESLIGRFTPATDANEEAVLAIRSHVNDRYLGDVDFEKLAAARGLSGTSFRRHWSRHVDVPPARYVARLRMREASRLLVETQLSIAEIARVVGFADPLYFSRRFRKETGLTATEYRRIHRPGTAPDE
jgi:AraC-like DNA-binding protein